MQFYIRVTDADGHATARTMDRLFKPHKPARGFS